MRKKAAKLGRDGAGLWQEQGRAGAGRGGPEAGHSRSKAELRSGQEQGSSRVGAISEQEPSRSKKGAGAGQEGRAGAEQKQEQNRSGAGVGARQ